MAAGLAALTALWIVLAIIDTGQTHVRRRGYWFSLLIGMLQPPAPISFLLAMAYMGIAWLLLLMHSQYGVHCRRVYYHSQGHLVRCSGGSWRTSMASYQGG